MIDADEARIRAERTATAEARGAAAISGTASVEPRNAVPPRLKRTKRVRSTAAALFARRLVGRARVASVMTGRGMSLALRRAASSLTGSLADAIEMHNAGNVAFVMVAVAVAVSVGVGVAVVLAG